MINVTGKAASKCPRCRRTSGKIKIITCKGKGLGSKPELMWGCSKCIKP